MTAEAATGDLGDFRERTRNWLEANCPAGMRTPAGEKDIVWGGRNAQYPSEDARAWLERMAERGWTAPTWPTAYGGGGLTAAHARVLDEELKRIGARAPLLSFGVWMLGPVLLEYATEEQKLRHLPPIVRGEIRWCQGYSEPGAGSDLAALQTRAEEDGDDFIVNGQKVWTSYADQADWIFCLVRTDPARKHEGISFLLIDMTSPGVEARPIRLISGASPFCETFFTDVRVPRENLVGRMGGGWEIAKRLLQYERQSISAGAFGRDPGLEPEAAAKIYAGDGTTIADPDLRARIAAWRMDAEALGLTVGRVQAEARSGGGVGPAASILKYAAAKLNQDRHELMVEIMGMQGLGWRENGGGDDFSDAELAVTRQWLRSKGNSIEGGTSEINLTSWPSASSASWIISRDGGAHRRPDPDPRRRPRVDERPLTRGRAAGPARDRPGLRSGPVARDGRAGLGRRAGSRSARRVGAGRGGAGPDPGGDRPHPDGLPAAGALAGGAGDRDRGIGRAHSRVAAASG
jgi:alkylation response protein AidB-like acyl-CoA dehydrogenase